MDNRFTQSAKRVLNLALDVARELKYGYVGSEHLLLALLSETQTAAAKILIKKGIDEGKIRELMLTLEHEEAQTVSALDMTRCLKEIIEHSAVISGRFGQSYIGTEHILYSIAEQNDAVAVKLLVSCGIYLSDVIEDLTEFLSQESLEAKKGQRQEGRNETKMQGLIKYGVDLTASAANGKIDPIIGRDEETLRVIQILCRRTKNNPCLIGEPGVGKTAVVEGLAQRIVQNNVPELLRGKTVFSLELSSMIAGAKYRGEFEERLKSVMEQVQKNPDMILFIDEIHTIVGAGAAEGAVDAANIIKPALARGNLQVIGATTFREYRKYIEKDAALERRFQAVTVTQPSEKDTVLILNGLREKLERHHGLSITDDAIKAAVTMSVKYIPDRFLPDKAIDLLDEAASKKRIENYHTPSDIRQLEEKLQQIMKEKENAIRNQDFEAAARLRDQQTKTRNELIDKRNILEVKRKEAKLSIGEGDIAEIVTAWTGVPVNRLSQSDAQRYLNLQAELEHHIIGQEKAVKTVADAMKRSAAGLYDPKRPRGSFLFLGPTGVGKTELAKRVTIAVFGSESAMIRLDMSEYSEKQSIARLIGSSPGYVGYDDGGQLTERVRRRPYSLILFDEIEKAHPDLYNALLQILDDGILTDAKGRNVDFKNTVIIMTSNVGSSVAKEVPTLGFMSEDRSVDIRKESQKELGKVFSMEFLNRIDEVVYFERLKEKDVLRITALFLEKLKERLWEKGMKIAFSEAVIEKIAREGFDTKYGARPLRRVIRHLIEDPVSIRILGGELRAGDEVLVTLDGDEIVFEIKA